MIYLFNLFINKVLKKAGFSNNLLKRMSCENLLLNNFEVNKPFSFIQVGANDGASFDCLYDFVIRRKASGIVIEPIGEYYNNLVENYKNHEEIIKVNKAVHPIENEIALYKIKNTAIHKYPDWVKGIASLSKDHSVHLGIDSNDIEKEFVEADSLMNIIKDAFKKKNVDFLQIDTEGFDYEVLKMVDFDLIKPKLIKYESVNLSISDYESSIALLKKGGYYVFKEKNDTIAINLKSIKLI